MSNPWIALSTCPLTQPSAHEAVRLLSQRGQTVRVYPADGAGGQALEADVRAGRVIGVLDLSLAELAAELTGSLGTAGPDRLTAAALLGVPQVIVLGALDAIRTSRECQRLEEPPTALWEGAPYARTTPEENDRLGREIALKASAARGPTAVLIPLRGLSALDVDGGPFWWPAADAALVQSLKNWMSPHVRVSELDLHINDPACAAAAIALLAAFDL